MNYRDELAQDDTAENKGIKSEQFKIESTQP